jgi:hypothetical protein
MKKYTVASRNERALCISGNILEELLSDNGNQENSGVTKDFVRYQGDILYIRPRNKGLALT